MIGPNGIRSADPQLTGAGSLWGASPTFLGGCSGSVGKFLARYLYARSATLATDCYRTSSPPADQSRTRSRAASRFDP